MPANSPRSSMRDAPGDVAHRHADEQARDDAAGAEAHVPHLPPPAHRLFAAKLDGHGAEDERHQQQHERQVKAGENRGIDIREGGEERAAARHEPDLVAVPDRADGVEEDAPLLVLAGEQVERADPQVEAVEHGVAGEEHAQQHEPDGGEVGRAGVHGWGVRAGRVSPRAPGRPRPGRAGFCR